MCEPQSFQGNLVTNLIYPFHEELKDSKNWDVPIIVHGMAQSG